ncbi:MAG TPA: nuclear transport factor 2 family protein [Candidatus Dormibacteraeota bacterium]|jgi:ketosteroid isomerase-like protein
MAQSTSTDQVQKLREGYEAFGRGDLEAIRGQFNPDIVWHIGGQSPMSGDYKGIDAVFEFFGRIFTETGGTLKNDVHDILANDTHGIVLLTQSAERNGKKLSMNFVQVVHRDAELRVTESWFLPLDANAVDEFWA